jgi:uncharacterized protein YaeQ
MAIGSTIYNFEISLSDTSREIYETISFRAARHSSEALDYLLCRVLAFCLEYKEGLEFSKGLDDPEMPAIWARDLTGRITDWIEIGTPSAEKLHKASKSGARVCIYTHKNPAITLELIKGEKIHRAEGIFLHSFQPKFIREFAAIAERNNKWDLTHSEGMLYVKCGGNDLSAAIESQRLL